MSDKEFVVADPEPPEEKRSGPNWIECWICVEERKKFGYGFFSPFGCVAPEKDPMPGPDLCDRHYREVFGKNRKRKK